VLPDSDIPTNSIAYRHWPLAYPRLKLLGHAQRASLAVVVVWLRLQFNRARAFF
jgi:hypothetical protein